jgi:acyl-CoA reductase-like NAD-dependent aldehyde dehydrogenase
MAQTLLGASERVPMPPDTPMNEVEAAIDQVSAKAQEWASLPAQKKLELFEQCLENAKAETDSMIEAGCASRGYDITNPDQGHLVADATLMSLGVSPVWIHGAIDVLKSIIATGMPPKASAIQKRPDGSHRLTVYPMNFFQVVAGDTGCAKTVPCGKRGYFDIVCRGEPKQFNPLERPACCVGVLGAGNTDIPNDIVGPMVIENSVVVYKANPVMARGAEVKRRIFQPLIAKGYLAIVFGGIEQGKMIVESPKTAKLACTGSVLTHDKIVWGNQDKTDPASKPLISKPFLSELGSVNPIIVVPGEWSARDLQHHAHSIIAAKMHNNGHICAAPQVIITSKNWKHREAFLQAIKKEIEACPAYRLFYPGVKKAYEEHKAALGGDVTAVQKADLGFDSKSPLIFKAGVSADPNADILALKNESFAPILIEVPIESDEKFASFMPAAVDFASNRCWGSLTCTIVVDDYTMASNQEGLNRIVDGMKFGAVGINVPPALANIFPVLTWGGFPGHTQRDVQSGMGTLGNFCCYENVEKSVMTGRFYNLLQLTNAGSPQYQARRMRRLCEVFLRQSYWSVAKFAAAHFIGC